MTAIASRAASSPPCASSVMSVPSISRAAASAAPSAERGVPGDPPALARERRTRGERLQTAVVGTVPLTGRAVHVDHHVPELGGRADRAAVEPRH